MVLRFDHPEFYEIHRTQSGTTGSLEPNYYTYFSMVDACQFSVSRYVPRAHEARKDIHMHEMIYPVLQGSEVPCAKFRFDHHWH